MGWVPLGSFVSCDNPFDISLTVGYLKISRNFRIVSFFPYGLYENNQIKFIELLDPRKALCTPKLRVPTRNEVSIVRSSDLSAKV